jgi:hypothetical protein
VLTLGWIGGKSVVSTPINKLLNVALVTESDNQHGASTTDLSLRISLLIKATPHHKLDTREVTIPLEDREDAERWIDMAMGRAYAGELYLFVPPDVYGNS